MSQIFSRSANTISRVSIGGAVLLIGLLLGLVYELGTSHWVTRQNVAREQPIQFSHERHVAGNGIDCRYCHTSVEQSRFAGIPPTKTCMNCHSQIFSNSPFLEPVRTSFNSNTPLRWVRDRFDLGGEFVVEALDERRIVRELVQRAPEGFSGLHR